MGDEYQLRKDVDELFTLSSEINKTIDDMDISSINNELFEMDTTIKSVLSKFGLNQESSGKFNYAIIKKEVETSGEPIVYEELWILANAYYNYNEERFVKIDPTHTSFGIEIQGNGTYHGEAELGYSDNTGINIWRNPKKSDFEASFPNWATDPYYDFSDYMGANSYIGLKLRSNDEWLEYGYMAGWTNSFMIDSYGGMTIGGSGFEIDGNGIFPFTRVTHSRYMDENNKVWHLLGLLDNAYHPTTGGWQCDSNATYSWFVGFKTPEKTSLIKDNVNTSFVVMYNDTPSYGEPYQHYLDVSKWHIVFEVNTGGIQ